MYRFYATSCCPVADAVNRVCFIRNKTQEAAQVCDDIKSQVAFIHLFISNKFKSIPK